MNFEAQEQGSGVNDVAIVGMSCIFPGAPDLKTYWRNIVGKVDSVSDPPAEWGADVLYDPSSSNNDRIYCKRGGFLHDLACFDPLEYGVMPSSIDGGEPDHFLALRVAHEALADAGYKRDGTGPIRGDRVEVIVGRGAYINRGFTNLVQHGLIVDQTVRLLTQLHPEHTAEELAELRRELKASLPPFSPEMAPGLVPNILSGRIANRLDLMGPNFTIDAACASSLIAVDRAIQDLLAGRCDMALTGGINGSSPPPIFMVFCQLDALSRRGKVQPFSEDADGTLLGEGLGLIVLKRKADALRDGDRIYALIKSVGSASDGRALGLLAPRVEGEELAMRRAYDAAGVSPSSVGLLEAHGTGTAVGDQTEAEALTRVFGLRNGSPPSCALGSVKSMISHLIPAAGIAGIIKCALSLHHKVLPPTLHCDRPNPKLGLDRTPLYINSETRPWIHGLPTPRRAGVNAFGFGGINAHAILEEFSDGKPESEPDGGPPWDSEVVILRATSRDRLVDYSKRVERAAAAAGGPSLAELAYAVNRAEEPGADSGVCLAIVASSLEDLQRKLAHSLKRLSDPACRNIKDASGIYFFERPLAREGKLAFLFPGEGSQYVNMFADLCLRLPPVRARFDLIDQAFSGHARGWLPSQVIFPAPLPNDPETREAQERRLAEMDFAAEATFAASQGMLALLAELEIFPDVLAGHSGGEMSALLAAGVIRVSGDTELIRQIAGMNQLYTKLADEGLVPGGCAIAVSGAEREVVLRALRESGNRFDIGMDNCPHQMVLCGNEDASEMIVQALRGAGAICTPLPLQRPFHTPAFEPYCEQLRPFFECLELAPARAPVYCAATARLFPDDPEEIRQLAIRQPALPVRFRETLETMHDDGARLFVEVGPKGALTSFVADTLRGRPHAAIACDLPHVSGILQLSQMLAQLAAHGVRMRLDSLYERRGVRRIGIEENAQPRNGGSRRMQLATGLTNLTLKEGRREWNHVNLAPVEHRAPASSPVPPAVSTPAPNDGSPMHAYLNAMDQFLAVQQEVMQAYLGGPRTSEVVSVRIPLPPAGHEAKGAKPEPATSAGGAETRPAVESARAKPAISPDSSSPNGHGNLLATLIDIISERTGYPADIFAPTLNLEADLGIDSIKRIEIFGVLHRQTGLVGPERMEHVSALKTIGEIVNYLENAGKKSEPPSVAPAVAASVPASLPLIGEVQVLEPGMKLVFLREFDVERDLFLKDHALGSHISAIDRDLTGLPLIPLTMTMELMAEAAAHLAPGQTVIEMRNVRGFQWLALDRGKLTLRVSAKRSGETSVQIEVRVDGQDAPVAEAIAILAARYPEPPAPRSEILRAPRPSQWTPERLYRDHMFHGPLFRGIESIEEWGENGLSATLIGLPLKGLFRDAVPNFLTDPVLVDAAGQMVGYWAAEHLSKGFNVFPYRIESLHLYGPPLPEGRRAACRATMRMVGESQIHADLEVTDSTGRLLLAVNGWEDVRVDLPDPFYRLCISPHDVFVSSHQSLDAQTVLCSMELAALSLFSANGGIWLRALAHAVLSPREREMWRELPGPERRRIDWLLGRCCAKDAVRLLARELGQADLLPADVLIVPDENGQPQVVSGSLRPAISISHADGVAVAAATLQDGMAIGIDVQRLDPSRDGFEEVALSEQERTLLPAGDAERRREIVLRFWCAKEAAGKALGYGLRGGPGSMIVQFFEAGDGSVSLCPAGALAGHVAANRSFTVNTSRRDDLIIATCLHRVSKELHELSI